MSRAQKQKLETYTNASFQLIFKNSTAESTVNAIDDCIEITLEKRKKEADKPIYLKRI